MKKIVIITLLLLGALGVSAYLLISNREQAPQEAHNLKPLPPAPAPAPAKVDAQKCQQQWQYLQQGVAYKNNRFKGTAGIVIEDLKRDYSVGINENVCMPSASLVKIPIMAATFYAATQGQINLKDYLTLKNSSKTSGSGILKAYPTGTQVTIEKLMEIMIDESDNTASNMLIDLLGFNYLNSTFKTLGLKNTNIVRKMMDFKSRKLGYDNYTTAADLAFMLEKIYDGNLISKDVSAKCLDILKKQKLRDRIPAKLPPGTIVAHKTGLERGVCHDAGIVFTDQGDMLVCVLTRHHDKTARPAKHFIQNVAQDAYNYAVRQ